MLVIGCGTGLDLPYLVDVVGPDGQIVGVDASRLMLDRARARIARTDWANVRLVLTDAADLSDAQGPFDAVLFTYSLAIIENWLRAWESATALLQWGGRVAVVDTDLPTGAGRPLRPLARVALWTGGVHRDRRVWQLVAHHAVDARHARLAHGYIHVAIGTWKPGAGHVAAPEDVTSVHAGPGCTADIWLKTRRSGTTGALRLSHRVPGGTSIGLLAGPVGAPTFVTPTAWVRGSNAAGPTMDHGAAYLAAVRRMALPRAEPGRLSPGAARSAGRL